ncbi:MAG: nickel pincer cofactor biosynthesis protein LarC [Candidatus Limiplasma sp.]|nr:nickel pincer cofactor biosynthesis protein LarC [Candidatus Limiplasma sp.]
MKTLYLECNMGAAGDMLMAALLELADDRQAFLQQMNGLSLSGVAVQAHPSQKCGILGTHVDIMVHGETECSDDGQTAHAHSHDEATEHGHTHESEHNSDDHSHHHEEPHATETAHHHEGLHGIEHIITELAVPEPVRADALAVFRLLAEAEGHVHGMPMDEIHFHEVGTMDAVADIVGVCLLMHLLAPEQVIASPVHVGSGRVRCAHGLLPVPAPATAYLLKDVPIYGGNVRGELCTPTGAALLRHFAASFGDLPMMRLGKIGYGMGSKDFAAANCVRAMLGETPDKPSDVVELCCNLDDLTPEAVGFAFERLMDAGALDVYTTSIGMKKNRPGVILTCMCRAQQRDAMLRLIFKHTTTLGVREYTCRRYVLKRAVRSVEIGGTSIRVKEASGWGVSRSKLEYEDVAAYARKNDLSLAQAADVIRRRTDIDQ